MTQYVPPGVYVEEIERGPRPIEGVPTSIAAVLGATERGTTRPCPVTSYSDFQRRYGGKSEGQYLSFAARGFFENGGERLFVCRIASAAATVAHADTGDYLLAAAGAGAWGNRVWVKLEGPWLRAAYFPQDVAPYDCFDPAHAANPAKPQVVEEYDGLDTDPGSREILRGSALVVLAPKDGFVIGSRPASFNGALAGGSDGGALDAADYGGSPSDAGRAPQGLAALEDGSCRHVALVCAPAADAATQRAIVAHCERHSRFAVLDAQRGATVARGLTPRADIADSGHAAFYSPWLEVANEGSATVLVPASGHVLGIYARTDAQRGVFKAPANEPVRGALGLELLFDAAAQALLTSRGVNVIREFPGRGIRVWGARTLSSSAEWKYVNVRRLLIYLERSIDEGTQWVVFEPNDESTWARVRGLVDSFLLAQWRAGALLGTRPEQAFFVRCDRTTMTQADIDSGRLVCLVGVAPVKPAEFILFTISQVTAQSR